VRDHIFLSYRRSDAGSFAGRLHDHLSVKYPVFRDVSGIAPGEDFRKRLDEALGRCRVLLAVIGDEWLDSRDEHGRRRIENSEDWVRQEISRALARNVPVIPVLVDEARMPRPEDLPEDLKPLADRQAVRIIDAYFADGVRKLTKGIGAPIHWTRWALCAAAMLAFTLVVLAAAAPGPVSKATAIGPSLELTGVTAAESLFDFQQPAATEIHVNSEFSRAQLLPKSARFLGITDAAPGKLEILTADLHRPGDLCRTTFSIRPAADQLDLRVSTERGPAPMFKVVLSRGRLRVSQHTVAADSSRPAQPGCDKEVRVAGHTVRTRQIPVDVAVEAPAEVLLQFPGDGAAGKDEPFPRFVLAGVTIAGMRRVTAGKADREWRGVGGQRMELVEVGVRNGEVEASIEGRIAEAGLGGTKWVFAVLAVGNGLLGLIGWRFNGLPVPGWRH
jgi:hypothetical protein